MQFKGKLLFLIFILFGLSAGASVFAASGTCPTDNGAGVVCSGGTPYYCLASCRAQTQCPSWTGTVCATGLTCPANCDGADSCGYCNSCSDAGATYGRTMCGSYPSQVCKDNLAVPIGCSSYSQCTNICSACSAGYELLAGNCVGASVKLGIDSVLSDRLRNSTSPLMTILSSGFVGIGTTAPNDYFSIGNSGAAPAGSSATGHNYTNTYLSTDDYALTNYGIVKTLIAAATSTMSGGVNFWGGAKNANIWNGDAGAGNVGIGLTNPGVKLDVSGQGRFQSTVFPVVDIIRDTGAAGGSIYGGAKLERLTTTPTNNGGVGFYFKYPDSTGVSTYAGMFGGALSNVTNGAEAGDIIFGSSWLGADPAGSQHLIIRATGATTGNILVPNGNVGIGTTTPAYKLTVVGTSYLNGQISTSLSGTGNRCLYVDATGNVSAKTTDCGTATGGDDMGDHTATQNILLGNYWLSGDGGNEGIFVNAGGNVGVGISNPTYQFQVVGSVYASNQFVGSSGTSANGFAINSYGSKFQNNFIELYDGPRLTGANNGDLTFYNKGQSAVNMFIQNGGNVGIGTSVPNDVFSIGNSGAAPAGSSKTGHNYTSTYLSTDNYALANYGIVKTLIAAATSSMPGAIDLWEGTKNGTIYNGDAGAGNVGIGTTTPVTKLELSGSTITLGQKFSSSNSKGYAIAFGDSLPAWVDASSPSTRIDTSGNFVFNSGSSGDNYFNFDNRATRSNFFDGVNRFNSSDTSKNSLFYARVGIGTTNPVTKLQVNDKIVDDNSYSYNANSTYLINPTPTSASVLNDPQTVLVLGRQGTNAQSFGAAAAFNLSRFENSGANSRTRLDIAMANGSFDLGNIVMTLLSSGNVGIGTTTPNRKLTVVGTSYLNGQITTSLSGAGNRCLYVDAAGNVSAKGVDCGTATGGDDMGDHTATQNILLGNYWLSGDGGSEGVFVNASGNVGIGTSLPNDVFSIGNSGVAPAGSSNTGHNYTSTYLSTDNYALANYGIVRTLIASATSTMPNGNYLPLAGGTMTGDVNFGARSITNLNNLTVSKITATTIDPLYNINGINYSTFAPSVVGGVKEELVGKADIKRFNSKLDEYEYIINFSLEDEGSDLWVWRKVVDYSNDNVLVFVTPSGKYAEVYYKIENNKLIFRSDRPVEVSYRLIGNRHDWKAWPTKAIDQEQTGVVIK